jgi:hypothetical protein
MGVGVVCQLVFILQLLPLMLRVHLVLILVTKS